MADTNKTDKNNIKISKANEAYVFRISPTKEQEVLINKTFGCCRFIYNNLLSDRTEYYKENKSSLKREVSYYKKDNAFLKEVDSLALANAKKNLDTAFKNFFEKRSGYPCFKKKGINESYTTNRLVNKNGNENISISNGYIKLPKLGLVKIKQHRPIREGAIIKSCTISYKSGNYYISILIEYEEHINYIDKKSIPLDKVIGLDYMSHGLYIDSNGIEANYPNFYRKSEKKLARLQKELSKKKKASNNYKKQLKKVQKLSKHIADQRKDFLHKLSNQITNDYWLICIEDINLSAFKKMLKLGKSTSDNGFGLFRTFLEYKSHKKGGYIIKIDKYYPSSKVCNVCGYKNTELTLKDREWVCPVCGTLHNRDNNAAINIKNEGYRAFMAA